jgi:hypothetical protein
MSASFGAVVLSTPRPRNWPRSTDETQRAVGLGATIEQRQPTEGVRVMRDPHGHLFCLFLPGG